MQKLIEKTQNGDLFFLRQAKSKPETRHKVLGVNFEDKEEGTDMAAVKHL